MWITYWFFRINLFQIDLSLNILGKWTKSLKLDFFNKFKLANFFKTEDRFKIDILYSLLHFSLVWRPSKQPFLNCILLTKFTKYVKFSWENECFKLTLKVYSRRLKNNPTSFIFNQFHIALQVCIYVCCHPFDDTIVVCVANRVF